MYFTDGALRVLEREMRQIPGFQSSDLNDPEDYDFMLAEMLSGFHNPRFSKRAWGAYRIAFSGRVFPNSGHRIRFEQQLSPNGPHAPRALAVLYLITADEELWEKISHDVYGVSVSFHGSFPCGSSAGILYRAAKELNAGALPEKLAGSLPTRIDNHSLALILTAFLIRQHGYALLHIDRR